MKDNLFYDGAYLTWNDAYDGVSRNWRATSGIVEGATDYRNSQHQCVKDKGPVPEGNYEIEVVMRGMAKADFSTCSLVRPKGGGIQSIPRGADAKRGSNDCESYWMNWGINRVQMNPADRTTRNSCSPLRTGFYIHDSSKGYSHGCIEVEADFFDVLRKFAERIGRLGTDPTMKVAIKYRGKDVSTYSYTDQPGFVGPL
jgi:hypothetical protein